MLAMMKLLRNACVDSGRLSLQAHATTLKQCLQQVRSSGHVEGEPDDEVFEARRGSTCFP